jgi:hypothetical protein
MRPPSSRELAAIFGFKKIHFDGAVSKNMRHLAEAETIRLGCLARAEPVQGLVWCIQRLALSLGAARRGISGEEAAMLSEAGNHLVKARIMVEVFLKGAAEKIESVDSAEASLTDLLISRCCYKGSDVRLSTGTLFDAGSWPRQSTPKAFWKWKIVLSFKWKDRHGPEHISKLELRAFLSTLRYRLRRKENFSSRMFHLLDSQACIGVISKGRTSARSMAGVLEQISALCLLANVVVFVAYISTDENPADRPSRWHSTS